MNPVVHTQERYGTRTKDKTGCRSPAGEIDPQVVGTRAVTFDEDMPSRYSALMESKTAGLTGPIPSATY